MALAAAGCGSASTTTTTHAKAPPSTRAAPTSIAAGSVAVVVGTPITRTAFQHWLYVAARSQGSQSPGQPVIVPDPPNYKGCVSQVRKQVPSLKKASLHSG